MLKSVQKDDSFRAAVNFAAHILTATFMFLVVAGAAVALGYFLVWVRARGDDVVPIYAQKTLQGLKIGLFAVDIFTCSLYVVGQAVSFGYSVVRALVRSLRGKEVSNER